MQALRRSRMAASPAFLRGGFRPFFLGGALWALVALALWLCQLAGVVTLPLAMDALAWHRHDMLFGFVGAVIAGFLLTAIPNWTGRLPIAGTPLLALALLWLAGRLALLFSAHIGPVAAAVVDVAFLPVLGAIAAREVLAARNRNLPAAVAVFALGIASALDHAAMNGLVDDPLAGMRLGLAVVTLLISLIGGRIVPSFTRNWLAKRANPGRLPTQPGRFDLFAIGLSAAALLGWTLWPSSVAGGGLLLLAAFVQLVRIARWQGHRTLGDPLVAILHIAYLWVPAGLALLGLAALSTAVPTSAAIHALTVGAMASMILAVMTRASLGHTGRALRADGPTTALYAAITLAALARVAAPLAVDWYTELMRLGGLLWAAAFLLFVARYGPILLAPRQGSSN